MCRGISYLPCSCLARHHFAAEVTSSARMAVRAVTRPTRPTRRIATSDHKGQLRSPKMWEFYGVLLKKCVNKCEQH